MSLFREYNQCLKTGETEKLGEIFCKAVLNPSKDSDKVLASMAMDAIDAEICPQVVAEALTKTATEAKMILTELAEMGGYSSALELLEETEEFELSHQDKSNIQRAKNLFKKSSAKKR